MGQNMDPPEIEYGDDCLNCFEAGKTPKYVYVRFSKIEKCPGPGRIPPNDHAFKLTQADWNPCNYFYQGDVWQVGVSFWGPGDFPGWLSLFDTDSLLYFEWRGAGCHDEGTVVPNYVHECGPDVVAKYGIAVITWRLEPLKVMSQLNITSSKLFMEMRPIDDGSRVYKFCKLQDATNIKIKYHPEA